MDKTKRGRINLIWGIILIVLVASITTFFILNKKDDPQTPPPASKVILTEAQAETVLETATENHYTHNKIKEVTSASVGGMDVEETIIYTPTSVYSKSTITGEIDGAIFTMVDEYWVKKESTVWYRYDFIEITTTVEDDTETASSYTKGVVSVPNNDARNYVDETSSDEGQEEFVEAYTESGITIIVTKSFDEDLEAYMYTTYMVKNGERVKAEAKFFNEQTGSDETLASIEYLYDGYVQNAPSLPNYPWREELTEAQAETIMDAALENHFTHEKIKEEYTIFEEGYEIESTYIYTEDMVYNMDKVDGEANWESWICKDGTDWYEHTLYEGYLRWEVSVPYDDARYYGYDGEEADLSFVEAYTIDEMTMVVFEEYITELDSYARATYIVKNGEQYQATIELYNDATEEYELYTIVEYSFDSEVTDVVPPLPTLPTGEVWELDDEVI